METRPTLRPRPYPKGYRLRRGLPGGARGISVKLSGAQLARLDALSDRRGETRSALVERGVALLLQAEEGRAA